MRSRGQEEMSSRGNQRRLRSPMKSRGDEEERTIGRKRTVCSLKGGSRIVHFYFYH